MEMVLFMRLESGDGYHDLASAMAVAQQFREQGVDAIAELAAGSPSSSIMVFYIKVPADQLEKAQNCKLEVNASSPLSKP